MTKKTILIVDDSATARLLFKISISDLEDYTIKEASNWQDALAIAKESTPFLIVLDYNMPEKVGTEVAEALRKDGCDSHLVLLTANTQKSVIDECNQLGFMDVLEKPVSADLVMAVLDKLS